MNSTDLRIPRGDEPVATLTRAFEELTQPADTLRMLARRTRRAPHAKLAASVCNLLADLHAEIERAAADL